MRHGVRPTLLSCVFFAVWAAPGMTAEDYSGQRLLDANFSGKQLQDARFDGSILRGAVFDGADLTGASFRKADVRGASFKGAKGLDANAFRNALYSAKTVWPEGFAPPAGAALIESSGGSDKTDSVERPKSGEKKGANPADPAGQKAEYTSPPSGVDMQGKDLSNQDFSRKYLRKANFDGTILKFAWFQKADLEGATFRGAQMYWTRFEHANLRGADFTGADLNGPFFIGANLSEANLENQILRLGGWEGYFEPVELTQEQKDAMGYELRELVQQGDSDRLRNSGLILKGANLKRAVIAGNLETVDFRKADLRGADLSDTKNAEPRFFKGAIYDSGTIWPRGFDPNEADVIKGEDLPAPSGSTAQSSSAHSSGTAPAKLESHGIAGYVWRVTSPGEYEGRLIFIYTDGNYSWSKGDGDYVEQQWQNGPKDEKMIILKDGPKGEDWDAVCDREDILKLTGKKSGTAIEAQRADPVK